MHFQISHNKLFNKFTSVVLDIFDELLLNLDNTHQYLFAVLDPAIDQFCNFFHI